MRSIKRYGFRSERKQRDTFRREGDESDIPESNPEVNNIGSAPCCSQRTLLRVFILVCPEFRLVTRRRKLGNSSGSSRNMHPYFLRNIIIEEYLDFVEYILQR